MGNFWIDSRKDSDTPGLIENNARLIDSSGLKTDAETIETFVFTCGGPFMFENGHYTIKVKCENAVSETMFEYYNSKNRFDSEFVK